MPDFEFTKETVDAEYLRLGHTLGWRFLTSSARNIDTAKVALVTQNPGGSVDDPDVRWSVETGNAYAVESWRGVAAGQDPLQKQVQRLFQIVGADLDSILSGYFVPFRSKDWKSLENKAQSKAFGTKLWKAIFARSSQIDLIFVFGRDMAADMGLILQAKHLKSVPANWAGLTIDSYICTGRRLMIVLPHLSRFRLFFRPTSESSFKGLFESGLKDISTV